MTATGPCRTDVVFHYLLGGPGRAAEIIENGLRPLSDFPTSERWLQIQAEQPGMFEQLYERFAEQVIGRPYENSGVFVTPIDFRRMPGSALESVERFAIPVGSLDPGWTALMYELEGRRRSLPFTRDHLEETSELWTADLIATWFARDPSRAFYHVPQVMCYQPGGIAIDPSHHQPPVTS